jgi:hypothetical protein
MIKLKDLLVNIILENTSFENWFSGSKIVDAAGKPIRLYHGTNKLFTTFKVSKEGVLGKGIYLTPMSDRASDYSINSAFGEKHKEGSHVMPLYASIKNPLIVHETNRNPSVDALVALGVEREKAINIVEKAFELKGNLTNQIYSRAVAQGYDGIVMYRDNELFEVVAFNPHQVKSIYNKTYTNYHPDLRKEESEL